MGRPAKREKSPIYVGTSSKKALSYAVAGRSYRAIPLKTGEAD